MIDETSNMDYRDGQDSREKRINAMKYKILKLEQENLKTREKTTEQMVETIRRIILDESKKNY